MLGTQPDIVFAVLLVSRHAANPTPVHMAPVKRIFQYFKGTIDLQLTFCRELTDLVGCSDSDWGEVPSICRSTAGFIFNRQ
jgi:hypothetical protein